LEAFFFLVLASRHRQDSEVSGAAHLRVGSEASLLLQRTINGSSSEDLRPPRHQKTGFRKYDQAGEQTRNAVGC